jgi:hypothetical protein
MRWTWWLGVLGCTPAITQGPATDTPGDDTGTVSLPAPEDGPPVFAYLPVDGAVCANGTPVGVGVSAGTDPETLVVLINGGGACWDDWTCFGLFAATHIDTTYDAAVMAADLAPLLPAGLLDRGDPATPFGAAQLAFVPYCTGDLHAGAGVQTYQADLFGLDLREVHHVGRTNTRAQAGALAAQFPGVRQVFLVGLSAGGYGALFNHDVYGDAFPDATVHVLSDGAPMVPPVGDLWATWQAQWAIDFPDGCTGCADAPSAVVTRARAAVPDARIGLITTTNDEVIRAYFGYGLADLTPEVTALVDAEYDHPNAHAYVLDGTTHVLLGGWETTTAPDGTQMDDWLRAFAAGDAAGWQTVTP